MVDADGRARHRHACSCPPATSARHGTPRPVRLRARRGTVGGGRAARGHVARAASRRSRSSTPSAGWRACASCAPALRRPWVVGCYLHTHSWDRRLDHADYYPFYAVVRRARRAGRDAGRHVGRPDAERVRPADRASTAPRSTSATRAFVLSHLGWPWVDEAIAMALKFPNVYLGTGAYPPRHWPPGGARRSCAAPAATRCCSAPTSRPSGTATRSSRSPSSGSTPTSSRRCSAAPRGRCSPGSTEEVRRMTEHVVGTVYGIPPQPPVEPSTPRRSPRARSRFGVEYRDLDPESLRATYAGNAAAARRARERARPKAGSPTTGVTDPRLRTRTTGTSTCASTCSTTSRTTTTSTAPARRHRREQRRRLRPVRARRHAAVGDRALRTRLAEMLEHAGGADVAARLDPQVVDRAIDDVATPRPRGRRVRRVSRTRP